MKDGRSFKRREEVGKGHPDKPMAAAERFEKFRNCTEGVIGESRLAKIWDTIESLEEVTDIQELTGLLVAPHSGR